MSYEQRARDYLDRFTEEPTWDVYSPDAQAALEALCESIAAEARATAIKEAARIPEEQARNLEDVVRSNVVGADQVDQLWIDRLREEHEELCKMADAIRNLAPRPDLRLVAREDLAKVIEAAETFVNNSSLVCVEIRKAINRLRAGEG